MKIKEIIKINGQIEVLTGLHIGGSSDIIEIGGMDSPAIKNPITSEPFIPGSSLKGKMRMLLEWYLNKVQDGRVCECSDVNCPVCRIFGVSSNKNSNNIGPARIIVRDATLNESWKTEINEQGFLLTESKTENNIDRITASANPRTIERVPAGAIFDFEIIYKVFDFNDNRISDEDFFEFVLDALKLVEVDYLGGGGSRGNGKIRFINLKKQTGVENKITEIMLPDFGTIKTRLEKVKN